MATFKWHVTDPLPSSLASSVGGAGGLYQVTVEDFDLALGNIPFLIYAGPDQPYERVTAQWRKDQFDTNRQVGEQSLTGWWLRSQNDFSGGTGIEYFEPLLGEGSETRFRDSEGVDVFNRDTTEVSLLHEMAEEVDLGNSDVELVAGPNRVLLRNGGSVSVWDGSTESSVTGTSTATGLAEAGSVFLVGDTDTIYDLSESSGTALSSLWTNFDSGAVKPFWVKQRIIATDGPDLYELTLAGGDSDGETPLYTHPDDDWEWTSVTETGGAIWAAGYSGDRSAVHVFTTDNTGATPTLTAATVAIQLPRGETVNAIHGYLNFLLVATSEGFRVALTDGAEAALGPLIFRDEALSVTARGDFAHIGLASGLTRRVDLGNEVAGNLAFAWANDLQAEGDVLSIDFYGDLLCVAGASQGFYVESATDLVASGFITTGWIRFGTLENKHFRNALIGVNATNGAIAVAAGLDDPPTDLVNLQALDGSRNVSLHLPGGVAQRVSLTFTLSRDSSDATAGPSLISYQVRAVPAPNRRQRLLQFPVLCSDFQRDRHGVQLGGPGFAWARLRELEAAEQDGAPLIMQDFRTGESRTVVIEQIAFSGPESPSKGNDNFGGTIALTVRTLD